MTEKKDEESLSYFEASNVMSGASSPEDEIQARGMTPNTTEWTKSCEYTDICPRIAELKQQLADANKRVELATVYILRCGGMVSYLHYLGGKDKLTPFEDLQKQLAEAKAKLVQINTAEEAWEVAKGYLEEIDKLRAELAEKDERIKELEKYEQESHIRDDEINNEWKAKVHKVFENAEKSIKKVAIYSGSELGANLVNILIIQELKKELLSEGKEKPVQINPIEEAWQTAKEYLEELDKLKKEIAQAKEELIRASIRVSTDAEKDVIDLMNEEVERRVKKVITEKDRIITNCHLANQRLALENEKNIPITKVQKAIEKLQEMKPCYTDDGMQNYNIDFAKRILDELLSSEGKENTQ